MKILVRTIRASGVLTVAVLAALVLLNPGSVQAQARIDGIPVANGATLNFTAGAGEVSTPDGGSIHFWGYQDLAGTEGVGVPQYPGPTLILTQGSTVIINLTSNLPFGQRASIVFPGHQVTASGGSPGLLTQESTGPGDTVSYTFTASEPGTYMYHSGTQPELQIEMGLVGAIIVRPTMGEAYAYNHAGTNFDHEYMFLLTSMDPSFHALAEQNRFAEIDTTARWPVYWFINGRAAPDDLAGPKVAWLPHQPYNCTPRMTPGQKVLVRIIGADQDQHALHLHGNHYGEIARYGRLLTLADGTTLAPRKRFTTLTVPGQTVDAIFDWTGEKLGWDIYGPADHTCVDLKNNVTGAAGPDGFADPEVVTNKAWEYCADHGKPFPVTLPATQNLVFGGWWSGSPFMGDVQPLPPGEGGLNPFGGFFFMWHSHMEKELTNFDIFPGGMLSMMVVEPPGTPIP
jgi:FtsP/CotA-like multicopper oxidase with cupredoxin domain